MAQHNIVHLYGAVQDPISIARNDQDSSIIDIVAFYMVLASIMRNSTDSRERSAVQLDQAQIVSKNADMTKRLAELRPNDVILLKGVVSTHDIPRYTVCKNCGKTYVINSIRNGDTGDLSNTNSMVTYIVPIDFEIVHRFDTEKEAIHEVMQHVSISNEVQLVGRLCADPKTYENGKSTAYQLGIDRHFFIAEDDPDISFDYPYIRSYDKQGISDMESLKKGSLVLVDGALRLRWFNRRVTCPDCGTEKTLEDHVLEVVPHYVEYLADLKPATRNNEKEPEI
ncbi:MAG: single-stranded DNA-binding protein [Roseburia faecis]|nr:single-stranded DNA-binding protein [Roseburia faecis]